MKHTGLNPAPRVLMIYYSLSGQSRGLINLFAAGIRNQGVCVVIERIRPTQPVGFPFPGLRHTLKMMTITFFRSRMPVCQPSAQCFEPYDLIVLAGPTWSYNPSGPILSFLDAYGKTVLAGHRVLPLISCRGYYRLHEFSLRRLLHSCGASVEKTLVYTHPVAEPWSTIGVFLKSAGYRPERMKWLAGHYSFYGHTAEQLAQVKAAGTEIGKQLQAPCTRTDTATTRQATAN